MKAGSGLATFGNPTSAGVPSEVVQHTLVLEYNNVPQLEEAFAAHGKDIACLMIEPVAGNMNFVRATPVFAQRCRDVTQHARCVFYEVRTAFAWAPRAQGVPRHGRPDMLGKVSRGGMRSQPSAGRSHHGTLRAGRCTAGTLSETVATPAAATLREVAKRAFRRWRTRHVRWPRA